MKGLHDYDVQICDRMELFLDGARQAQQRRGWKMRHSERDRRKVVMSGWNQVYSPY